MALSDANGDTVQAYEYSVYGEVAVEDANHPNPYMFAGVRYDIEIGLYYNRARYYNPFTGRFLQTDPIGYKAGMNLYAYCTNRPTQLVDPSGLTPLVTGRYWVVPEQLCLSDPIPKAIGVEELEEDLALGIIQIDPSGKTTVSQIDAQLAAYEAFLKMASTTLTSKIPFGLDLTLGWRAYIEVRDWNDMNTNNQVDEGDTFSDPYWIEITGFPSGSYANSDSTTATWVGGRYMTSEAAADAAGTAIGLAWTYGNPPGALPSAAKAMEWADDSVEDPYNRDTPYR